MLKCYKKGGVYNEKSKNRHCKLRALYLLSINVDRNGKFRMIAAEKICKDQRHGIDRG